VTLARLATLSALVVGLAVLALPASSATDPWAKLRRPLHLPRLAPGEACPVSTVDERVDWTAARIFGGSGIGPGPVYPGLGGVDVLDVPKDTQYGGPWGGQKVFWYVLPSYRNRVLLRGRRLDGPQWLRFDQDRVPSAELRLDRGETVSWDGMVEGSRGRPSSVRARASGCYGVQMDGSSFSRVVVFRVALAG
jgi:hypothetical protein